MHGDRETERGARSWGPWSEGWRSPSWASARALWARHSPEDEAEDDRTWCDAACEDGGLLRVLWCEVCQLFHDVVPFRRSKRNGRGANQEKGGRRERAAKEPPVREPLASEQAE